MTTAMLVNVLIMVIMSLAGVVMGIILFEIRKVRERLHKIEGGYGAIEGHLKYMNDWLENFKDVPTRLTKLETIGARR